MNSSVPNMVYGADYREKMRLADGLEFVLRPISSDDKGKLLEGFDRLSRHSRYERFHGHKRELSERELAYFTEVDGFDHFAIIALALTPDGEEGDAMGGSRLVRLSEQPNSAEISVTVVDAYQGRGLGRLLLDRLVAAAAERRIDRIRVHVLAENERMRALIARSLGEGHFSRDGAVLIGEFRLLETSASEGSTATGSLLRELLRLAAHQSIAPLRLALGASAVGFAALDRQQ